MPCIESTNGIITLREVAGILIGALAGSFLTYLGAVRIQNYHHFRVYVTWYRRRRFDDAWKNYFGTFDDFPGQYHKHPEDKEYCKKMFEIIEHRLEVLLGFT
jgi:hypothetical protein